MVRNQNFKTVLNWLKSTVLIQHRKYYTALELFSIFLNETVLNNAGESISQLSFTCNLKASVRKWGRLHKIEKSRRNWAYIILHNETKIDKTVRISPRRKNNIQSTIVTSLLQHDPSNTPSDIPSPSLCNTPGDITTRHPSNSPSEIPPPSPSNSPGDIPTCMSPPSLQHSPRDDVPTSSNSSETLTSQLTLDAIASMRKKDLPMALNFFW